MLNGGRANQSERANRIFLSYDTRMNQIMLNRIWDGLVIIDDECICERKEWIMCREDNATSQETLHDDDTLLRKMKICGRGFDKNFHHGRDENRTNKR